MEPLLDHYNGIPNGFRTMMPREDGRAIKIVSDDADTRQWLDISYLAQLAGNT